MAKELQPKFSTRNKLQSPQFFSIITNCTTASNINKLTLLQIKAIHIISGNNTGPIFKPFRILPYIQLITCVKLSFIHRHIHSCFPIFPHSTISSTNLLYYRKRQYTSFLVRNTVITQAPS
jgi:hypothetical protein